MTVLLSLTVSLILSLILALFSGARISAAKMRAECVTETGIESVLAEYNRELFERYDLLMTDMSYGGAAADVCNTEEHLRKYVQMNLDGSTGAVLTDTANFRGLYCSGIRIPEITRGGDGNGAVLRRQIFAYMQAEPLENAFAEAAGNVEILQTNGYDTYDTEAEMDANYAEMERVLQGAQENPDAEGAGGGSDVIDKVREVHEKRRFGILTLAHPDASAISRAAVTPSMYASHRGLISGNGYRGSAQTGAAQLLLFDQYLFEKCGSHAAVRDGSRLQYQLEYILAGKGNDYANLEAVAAKLLFWREASNFLYIMTDTEKCNFAEGIAGLVSVLLMLPELKDPLKMAILFAWSFSESVSDIRILLDHGRVPLVKSRDTWKTSFANLLGFGRGAKGNTGLDYEDYLRMLVLMTDLQTKTMRLMDIIEMDLRETPGNPHFTIDGCIDCLTAEVSFGSNVGFSGTFIRRRGYTEWFQ